MIVGDNGKSTARDPRTGLREGHKGKPLPAGKKFGPPPGPAADVPAQRHETKR